METINIKTLDKFSFDSKTTPLWAILYAHMSSTNRLDVLINELKGDKYYEFWKALPIEETDHIFKLGNWIVKKHGFTLEDFC